jgi:uncharacterized protein RhaS with RHS repeats
LDNTGLYYYGGRYYDPDIGRFISPDPFVQCSSGFDVVSSPLTVNFIPAGLGSIDVPQGTYPQVILAVPMNPQALNRYSYVLNNPLRYMDPTGYFTWKQVAFAVIIVAFDLGVAAPITLVAIAAPAVMPVAAIVDIFATALTIYCLIQIAQDSTENDNSITPQLPTSNEPEPVLVDTPEPTTPPVTISSPENSAGSGVEDDWYWWNNPTVIETESESELTIPTSSLDDVLGE